MSEGTEHRSELSSWNDTRTREAIVGFVERVTTESGPDYVAAHDRIAVFDNDGTLWCEKPMPIEVGFILHRLAEMCEADESLRERQPWKAAYEQDHAWLGNAITKHYHGDDNDVKVLMGGIIRAFAGVTVEEYGDAADAFLRGRHPTLDRNLLECGYQPMIELLRYLDDNGFTNYIASGGDRDFMRPITEEVYGIPSERNSNGDIPMLHYAGGQPRPALRLLVLHDDPDREFDYVAGAETSLERAANDGWTVVSIKDDWNKVFAGG
jgi:haloacid dehalogenase-like hydrolase